jgi:transposase
LQGLDGRNVAGALGVVQPRLAQWQYSIRRERLLIQQLEHDLLFRWCVGISTSIGVWNCTVFSKNGECLLAGDIVLAMFLSTWN